MLSVDDDTQAAVFAFLERPESYVSLIGRPAADVTRIDTHGAVVFLAGTIALKVKRAVRLAYLDFSTLERRAAVCRHEIALNQPAAPEIYQRVVAITATADGGLAIDGAGAVVEWGVLMARFPADDLLDRVADSAGVSSALADALANMALAGHARAPVTLGLDTGQRLDAVVQTIADAVARVHIAEGQAFASDARTLICRHDSLLRRRSEAGLVRRCHGDLHLGNIVLWHGGPVPFDAIEFDDDLATVDVLYDLAFLLMDLDRHGARAGADRVLNRYLAQSGRPLDIDALALLPAFLAIRAGVRAMVAADRAGQVGGADRANAIRQASATLTLSRSYLAPPPARLIAVGGLSGTGKSTLAAALAPLVGAAPGALHLRSDVERKALAGIDETTRLPPSAYTADAAAEVYRVIADKARRALGAGHSVIVDAVFARPEERQALAELAGKAGVPFQGLWLNAGPDEMQRRVTARRGDASDATADVVQRQLTYDLGAIDWVRIDSGRAPQQVLAGALSVVSR